MKRRVLLARLSHETHTFLRARTLLSDFSIRVGSELLSCEGDASSLAGSLSVARECLWEVIPAVAMDATPSGMVTDEVVETFWRLLRDAITAESERGIDGICMNMHGAMVSESIPDVEGELLRRVRGLPGMAEIPICGSLDLHGNYTQAMARYGTALVAYRENPHTDIYDTAVRAARLLDRLMETGSTPKTVHCRPAIVWPPSGTATADSPMAILEAEARKIESENSEIAAVNVFAGFSFADIPETGVSFSAITLGDPSRAHELLMNLCEIAESTREHGVRLGVSVADAISDMSRYREGPILLVEPADNIGGGAPGDLTIVFRALLELRVENAAVCLNDPESVDSLWDLPPGTRKLLAIGGKSGEIGAEPQQLEVEMISRSDGRYLLEDPHSHAAANGLQQTMGRCVVVQCEGVRILLTSLKTAPWDLGQWRSQGIEPKSCLVIGVKAAVAHRQAYDPIARASYLLDTAGPCAENLLRLPYRNIRRPIWPLDP